MKRIRTIRTLAAALLVCVPLMTGGPAHAQPAEGDKPQEAASVTLGSAALGIEREVFLAPNASQPLTLPVPGGLSPTRLRGTLTAPVNIAGGYLEVDDADGNLLGTVNLPPAGTAQAATPFDVDISAVRVQSSSADLSVTLRSIDNAGQIPGQFNGQYCGPLQQLTLTNLAAVFTGAEPPVTTIAGFFPPVLERVTIHAPNDADAAEQQATLLLVATLVRLYNPQPLAISVISQQRGAAPPPSAQLARAVVVERGGATGLRVENPGSPAAYLRISGNGDELSTQVSLLVEELQSLAQVSTARVDQAGSEDGPSGDTLTFDQLNLTGRTEVLRSSNLRVGIGRTALGNGRVGGVQVHLLADYTPVPDNDAAAVVIRSSDGDVVYRSALDKSGRMDAQFELSGQTTGQFVNLDMALTYTPEQPCGPLVAPITFQIDPRSTLTVQRGGPPLGGFSAMPSEFAPSFLVAMDGSDPGQLIYASRIVAAIAGLTDRRLTPKVVDVKTAADADSGALILAESSALLQNSLHPPLSGDGSDVSVDDVPTELRAEITDGLGSIQVFADRPRDRTVVLVVTTGAWSLVDPLFDHFERLDGKWAALTGDVLAAGEAGVPTNLSIFSQSDDRDAADQPAAETSSPSPRLIGIAVAVLVVLAIAAAILWAVRRRRTRGAVRGSDDAVVGPGPPA